MNNTSIDVSNTNIFFPFFDRKILQNKEGVADDVYFNFSTFSAVLWCF